MAAEKSERAVEFTLLRLGSLGDGSKPMWR